MSTLQTRQPRGITTGGQFAAPAHAEPDVLLAGLSPADIQELAKPIEMPPGSSVYIDGQRGTVSHEPSPLSKRIIINLDAGGSVYARKSDAVPWDGWLDVTMPAVEHDLLDSPVPTETADRMLHAQLRALRNSYDAAADNGETYHAGRAQGAAETAASLIDTRLDPAGIRSAGAALLAADKVQSLRDRDALVAVTSGAPITPIRARQLAGHFADEAVLAYTEAMGAEYRGEHQEAQAHHGRTHAYLASALRFIDGCEPDPRSYDREQAMVRVLIEGADRPNEIIRAGLSG